MQRYVFKATGEINNIFLQSVFPSLFQSSTDFCLSIKQLMEAIHKQEEINYRLQDYIDKIIVAIMESNPSILEVK